MRPSYKRLNDNLKEDRSFSMLFLQNLQQRFYPYPQQAMDALMLLATIDDDLRPVSLIEQQTTDLHDDSVAFQLVFKNKGCGTATVTYYKDCTKTRQIELAPINDKPRSYFARNYAGISVSMLELLTVKD